MLAALGELVDDIVVTLGGPINVASDTDVVIERRRGGSAANVAASAARLAGSSRLLGQVGDDRSGAALRAELAELGVGVESMRVGGHTGSIVVLVDTSGERTMLTDPGASRSLSDPEPEWLDGVDVLHVPFYSLVGGPIAETATTLIGWAHARSIAVSIDLSSLALIEQLGAATVAARVADLCPDAVFANLDEATALAIDEPLGGALTFVNRGAGPATVYAPGASPIDVRVPSIRGAVDTTGAGDAFAAGVLTHAGWQADPVTACAAGHASAAAVLSSRIRS